MGGWVTRSCTVKEYGWTVKMRDANVREVLELGALDANTAEGEDKVLTILAGIIVDWDVTSRSGALLPVSKESLYELPNQVIAELMKPVMAKAAGLSDPKDASESTPTTPPKPEVSS